MTYPLVSVVMPVFNAEAYVATAVRSILTQTLREFEFLIFDDGSTDRSYFLLERFAQNDPRIRLFREGHRGIVGTLNEGIARARGAFIARMDADDISLPQRLARQAAYLRQHPECVVVGGDCLLTDPEGWPIRRLWQPVAHAEIDNRHIQGQGLGLAHPTVMYRKKVIQQLGGYRPEYQYTEDLDLWLRVAEVGRLANLPEVVLRYRQHFQSICHQRRARQLELIRQLLDETRRRRGLPANPPQPIATTNLSPLEMHQLWAEMAQRDGYGATARKHFWRVLRQRPQEWHLWRRLVDVTLPPLGTLAQRTWQEVRSWRKRGRATLPAKDHPSLRRAA
jgi:GT2 family glycosyltransferase